MLGVGISTDSRGSELLSPDTDPTARCGRPGKRLGFGRFAARQRLGGIRTGSGVDQLRTRHGLARIRARARVAVVAGVRLNRGA